MIILNDFGILSPILLSVILIVYLMVYELGSENIKNSLKPMVIVLGVIFAISAILDILSKYKSIS